MEKKIVFIRKGMSFMTNAISQNLQEAGYEISYCMPSVAELEAHKKDAEVYVFYLGKFVADISDVLVYLKDICLEEEKSLVLLGNPVELAAVDEYIPEAFVACRFERPFDIKKLIAALDRLLKASDDAARRKNILLVDDDGAFLKMVKGWLSEKYHVTIVNSGAQALMYVADNTPDLILLDYDMPVTSGPQVLGMLRSETKVGNIPVIFLTGKGDRESVLQVLALKPDGYLLKSMTRARLLAALADFFEKKKYEQMQ